MTSVMLHEEEVHNIVSYCAKEVYNQQRGPLQVPGMVDAWLSAIDVSLEDRPLDTELLQGWAFQIEPTLNHPSRWRGVNVTVGTSFPPRADEVPQRMERWFEFLPNMTAGEAYREFETVHPFRDGNGRVGKIIFNYLLGTLRKPEWPPDYFGGISNP